MIRKQIIGNFGHFDRSSDNKPVKRCIQWTCILLSLAAWGTAGAQPAPPTPPATVLVRPQRLMHRFDFEERKLGNFEDLPMHWYVIGRPPQTSDENFLRQPLHQKLIHESGFPAYAPVAFDTRYAVSGQYSFHLGLDGGDVGAFVEIGTLPAVPTSDYRVTAKVRTAGLERALAYVIAYFVDAQGHAVAASRVTTAPIHTSKQWTNVSVRLAGRFPDAAWIGLEVKVLQPRPNPDGPLGKQQIVLKDVRGDAWFDDIDVWQLPHVDIRSQSPVNVIDAPQHPILNIDIRDLTGRQLRATATIYDVAMHPVAKASRAMGAGRPMTWQWEPPLPAYGWYLADLQVWDQGANASVSAKPDLNESANEGPDSQASPSASSGPSSSPTPPQGRLASAPVARTLSAVLWLPKQTWPTWEPTPSGKSREDAARFVISARGVPDDQLAWLPVLLKATGLHAAVISAWNRKTTLKTLDERHKQLDQVLRAIFDQGATASLSLSPVPDKLAQDPRIASTEPLALLRADSSLWLPYLGPLLMREGRRIKLWQLGTPEHAAAFYNPNLGKELADIQRQFADAAPQPRLVIPWRIDQSRPSRLPATAVMAMNVSPGVPPASLPDYLAPWNTGTPVPCRLYLHEPSASRMSHLRRTTGLALRMVRGWQAGAAGMVLTRPWTTTTGRDIALLPDPLLGVFTNVAHRLAGRRVAGELPLHKGLEGLILDGPAGGMIAAWNRGASPNRAMIDMKLGGDPVAIDLWGNRTAVPTDKQGRHHLALTSSPVFITGIDAQLALLRASFKVTPAFIESTQAPHQAMLIVHNPWPGPISGSMRLSPPKGWSVRPTLEKFSLQAGGTLKLPVEITLPFAALAGPKRLTAHLNFTAKRRYVIDVWAPMTLGLHNLAFTPTALVVPGKQPGTFEVTLTCQIVNTGDQPRSLSVFASFPKHPRQARSLGRLAPGATVVRRFHFTGLTQKELATPMRTGVRELNGPAMLNELVPLMSR